MDIDWARLLFEESADAIFILDAAGRILHANRTACERLGYTAQELTQLSAVDLHATATKVQVPNLLNQLSEHGWARADIVHQTKTGTPIPTEINSRSVVIDGEPVILTIAREMADRKLAETTLLQSQQRFELLFDSYGMSNSFFDAECRMILCNDYCARLIGLGPPDSLVGKSLLELFDAERGPRFQGRMLKAMETHRPATYYSEFLLGSETRWLQTSYNPLLDKEGGVFGVQLISQDVTENHLLEERLRRAEKLESIGILAGGIAHDFNNLLAGLSGNLDLLELELTENRTAAALDRLKQAYRVFDRAKALTKQLLTFSKGGQPVTGIHNLAPLLPAWAEFALSGSDISLNLDLAPDLWPCECDSQQIGQVVDNLVINARQASHPGGNITLRAENLLKEKPYIQLTVADQGMGIDPGHLAKVFDPFFTTKPTGTGLGLATCQSIVQKHGGWMDIQSVQGQGTSVTVCLPASWKPWSEAPALGLQDFHGQGRALVLDDEGEVRHTLGALLASMGFSVEVAQDGEEALDLVRSAHLKGEGFLVALLDLTVPGGKGGQSVALELRRQGFTFPLIAISGYSDWSEKSLLESGFALLLPKPFSRQQLAQALHQVLDA